MSKKEMHAEYTGPAKAIPVGGEANAMHDPLFGDAPVIEPVTQQIDESVATEAFMNEKVLIRVNEATHEFDDPGPCPQVNGENMPLRRGVPTWVKRHFVEALVHSKPARYTMQSVDPYDPSRRELQANISLTYGFSVIEDRNPKGRAWLEALLAQPA